jgi:hypothetical protein
MKLPLFPRTQITHPPEYKGKPKLYPIIYPPQPLMKASFKQLKQMFPNTNEHDHVLKWAADNIKHNDLQALYLRHYKQNPQVHTEENKNKLGHINGMMDISSEMKNVKIDKNDTLESAFKKYDDAEKTWRQGNGVRYVEAEGKPVVDFGDGWAWFDLGRPTCGKEGAAMGHCGNSGDPHPDDRILSLRKIVKVGDKTFHEPALTFINNHGWLGEMKGRANSKPAESYHKRIVELLKHPDIKGMVGAGYMPENNFHFDDLSPEHKNQVRMSNPNLVDLRSDDWDEKQKIFASDSVPKIEKYQHTVKDIFKGKRLKEDLDSGKINIDDLEADDLRLLTKHRLFQREHLFKLIKNAEDIYNSRTYAQALMAAKNSKHLDDDAISYWVNNRAKSAAQVLGNKLSANHIQIIAENDPEAAAEYLEDHHLFNQNHIDTIAEKNPYLAAEYLKDHRLFNQSHVDTIVQKAPSAAAEYLSELLNASHIQIIAENDPQTAADYLYKLLNASHIQIIAENDPEAAAEYLEDHHLFNQNHIDTIAKKNPYLAAEYLKDHHLLNANHIQTIAENDPEAAAEYLKDHRLLNANHIQTIIENDPKSAEKYLKNHPEYEIAKFRAKYDNLQKSLQKSQQLEKVLVSSEPSEGVLKIAKYDGMRPNETHVSTTRVPHERFGSVYVHHFESDDGTNARHLVSMHHDPHQAGVSVLLAARQNKNKPMTVYAAATHPNFQGNRLNYVALREAVKSHGTLHSDVMQSMPAFKNWNRLKQEAGFKVNITKPYREPSAEDASMMPHIAQYSKQAERKEGLEKAKSIPKNIIINDGEQKLTNALQEVAKKHNLHDPEKSYWECDNLSRAVHKIAKEMGIKSEIWTCKLKYDHDMGEIKRGQKHDHSFLKIGNNFHDYTASQATSKIPSVYISDKPHSLHTNASLHENQDYYDKDGSDYWYKSIHEELSKSKISPNEQGKLHNMEKAVTPEQQKENIKKQRELKNKEIIAKLKSKVVDKAPAQEASIQPRLLMSEDDSPVGIPIYLKTHPSHDNLVGVHVHVDKLPSLENHGILDEPRIDRALDSAESRGHSAIYVSADQIDEPKKPKLQLVKSKLAKAYDIDTAVVAEPYLTAKYRKNELNSNHIDYYVKKHPAIAAEHLADKLTLKHINHIVKNSPIDAASFLGNKLTPRNVSDIVIASPGAAAAHLQDKLNYGHINYIVKTAPYAAAKNLAYHPLFNQNHIDTIVQHDPSIAAFYFKDHPLLNTKHIDTIAQNSPKAAAAYFAHNLYYLKKYGDSKKINFSSNTENLRKLRDIAEANGGSIHSKQLTQHGLNENALNIKHLKDAKGNYSAQAIQNHIDSLPKHSYAFSKTTWDGDQRHTDKTQNVFQLNITPEIIEKLQQEGVFDTFKQAHNILYSGSHPAHGGTLGWVRYNKSGKQYHIDEIQTDLGHNNLSKLRQTVDFLHENQRIDDDKKNELLQLFTPDKLKKMHNILFSNQVSSKLIHEAFLQHMRNKGKVGSSVHIWQAEPKAKLANQDVSKELPVHMKVGYDEVPPKMDYTEAKYGDAAPQKNNQFRGEPTWKTTLRKSIANRLNKALLSKPPQIVNGQYAKPFSMGGTKKEKKTIYSHFSHPEHAKFNAQEHIDAYWRHQEKIKQNPKMESSLVNFHKQQAQQHWDRSRDLVDKGDTSRQIG